MSRELDRSARVVALIFRRRLRACAHVGVATDGDFAWLGLSKRCQPRGFRADAALLTGCVRRTPQRGCDRTWPLRPEYRALSFEFPGVVHAKQPHAGCASRSERFAVPQTTGPHTCSGVVIRRDMRTRRSPRRSLHRRVEPAIDASGLRWPLACRPPRESQADGDCSVRTSCPCRLSERVRVRPAMLR